MLLVAAGTTDRVAEDGIIKQIPNKEDTRECTDLRIITLLSIPGIVATVMLNRTRSAKYFPS